MKAKFATGLLVAAAALTVPAIASAQSAGGGAAPQTIAGTLTAASPRDGRPYGNHVVTLNAGTRYRITAVSTDFDTVLQVLPGSGTGDTLAENDDADGQNAGLTFVPPTTGRYTLRVLGFDGTAAGRYALNVAALPPLPAPTRPTPIRTGTMTINTYHGEIAATDPQVDGKPYDEYLIRLEGGRDALISVDNDTAGFDTILQIFTVNGRGGEPLASDDDSGGDMNPRLTFRPETTGDYVVRVIAFDAAGRGGYTLQVAQ